MNGGTIIKLICGHIPAGLNVHVVLCELSTLHTIVPCEHTVTIAAVATSVTSPTHWALLMFAGNEGCYIDSLANDVPDPVRRLLEGCCLRFAYSKKPLQTHQNSCGHLVAYVACKLLKGLDKETLCEQIGQLKNCERKAAIWLRALHHDGQ